MTASPSVPAHRYSAWAVGSMAAVHVLAILGFFFFPPSRELLAVALISYYLRMFGITAGFHRYFAHRAFRSGRIFQFILAFVGGASMQRGALWWAAHHRDHHRLSDQEGDIHSPVRDGFWWSHIGWVVHTSSDGTKLHNIKDFADNPELRFLDRWHLLPPAIWALALYAIGGLPWLAWGMAISTVALWHGTFFINSLAHVWGTRTFKTTDASRNNAFLALVTMGEGWHNNHHHYQSSARQGFTWWQVDASFMILKGLEALGIVWKLKAVPERVLGPEQREVAPVSEVPATVLAGLLGTALGIWLAVG